MRGWKIGLGRAERGVSAIETMIAIALFSVAIIGAAAISGKANGLIASSARDTGYWAALSMQAENLLLQGHAAASSGSATVGHYSFNWTSTGSGPKKVLLVGTRPSGAFATVQDTVVLYLSELDP